MNQENAKITYIHAAGLKFVDRDYIDTNTVKPKHGGKRKGAGRKPLPVPKKAISVKLDAVDIAELNAICERRRMSQAGLIAEWIQAEPQ